MVVRRELLFNGFLLLYFFALTLLLLTTPISSNEAELLYRGSGPSAQVARWLHSWMPGLVGLRLFPFLLGLLNAWLYWEILTAYFTRRSDRRFAFFLYLMLPGVIASGALLNEATYAFTMVLLFLTGYRRQIFWLQLPALILLLPTPTAAFAFYAMLGLYGYRKGEYRLVTVGLLFLFLSFLLGGYDFSGRPRGHFLELLGVYAALFSPLFFIYYFYSLYRVSLEGPRDIYWYIASGAMVISILLSVRQQVLIVDFSPYLLAGAMIPVAVYFRSLRVRMRSFQRPYRLAGGVVIATMILSALALFLHRPLYRILGSPRGFFAAPLYRPYDLAEKLKQEGKTCYPHLGKRYEPVMKFYGLRPCKNRD